MPDPHPGDSQVTQGGFLLEVRSVEGGYVPGCPILQGVSLGVKAGEIVTIVGPNGAGKSTLAKAILGLLPITGGDIVWQGRSLRALSPQTIVGLGIGYVPQNHNVFPSLTVAENLDLGGFLQPDRRQQRREALYQLFPRLAQRRQQRAESLSGGERQILAMAKALMLEPRLLVLDEPSAALSPPLTRFIFEQIQRINTQGTAILLVEQNARSALAFAHRGYVLEQGRDRFTGLGTDLLNNPQVAALYLGQKR